MTRLGLLYESQTVVIVHRIIPLFELLQCLSFHEPSICTINKTLRPPVCPSTALHQRFDNGHGLFAIH